MAFEVFDFRRDGPLSRNFFVSPQIRARFLRLEAGQVAMRHSHDLGQEVFLVLEGRCEFEIGGHREVLGPGQACVARVDEFHQVRAVGGEPVTMYLSVTPHIQPTHTYLNETGEHLPPRYSAAYAPPDSAPDTAGARSTAELVDVQGVALTRLVEAVEKAEKAHERLAAQLKRKLAAGDKQTAIGEVDAMWSELKAIFRATAQLAEQWNDLAARFADESAGR